MKGCKKIRKDLNVFSAQWVWSGSGFFNEGLGPGCCYLCPVLQLLGVGRPELHLAPHGVQELGAQHYDRSPENKDTLLLYSPGTLFLVHNLFWVHIYLSFSSPHIFHLILLLFFIIQL